MTLFLLLGGSALAFLLPLRRRAGFTRRVAFCLAVALLPLLGLSWGLGREITYFFAGSLFGLVWGVLTARFCVELDWIACCYCAIWMLLTADVIYELWLFLTFMAVRGDVPLPSPESLLWGALQLVFFALCCLLVYFTIARGMPNDGRYHIGPRQMLSAVLLGGMFWFQFFSLQRIWAMPQDWSEQLAVPAVLTQLYCLTLLYLQTELFKKSAMQKEMAALNLLYDRQRQQYRVARQNVQIINRKCHELKVQIADLRKLRPDAGLEKSLDEAEQAARLYNADVHTGNEVLDVALTEKSLLCESHGIRLNCVADGGCLTFLDPADLYALFANALDPAIEAASRQTEADHAMIDLLLYARQGFAVLNLVGPEDPGGSKAASRDEFKVVRRIAQKYSGTATAENREGFASLKVLIPLQSAS